MKSLPGVVEGAGALPSRSMLVCSRPRAFALVLAFTLQASDQELALLEGAAVRSSVARRFRFSSVS